MSHKRNQRRKWQRREQPAWYRTEPKWTVVIPRRLNVPVAYHPLAGLGSRQPYVRHSTRLARFDADKTRVGITQADGITTITKSGTYLVEQ